MVIIGCIMSIEIHYLPIVTNIIVPTIYNYFSIFHLIFIIPIILIESTIIYLLLHRTAIFNYKIKYRSCLLIFLIANLLTTIIGMFYPFINSNLNNSHLKSIIIMYIITVILEVPILYVFLKNHINKPVMGTISLSIVANFLSYLFIIVITRTPV